MLTREDFKVVLQFFFTFTVTAGSIIAGAMLETGTAQMPRQAVVLLALLTGFGVAAQRAQAVLEGKPQETVAETVKQLVAQMRTVQAVTAQQLPSPAPVVVPIVVPAERTWAEIEAKARAQAAADTARAAPAPPAPAVPSPTPVPKERDA